VVIEHVVTTGPVPSGLEDVAEALSAALARHGITTVARAEYLHPALNGYDWDALDLMAVHTHGRPMQRPPRDCIRFRLQSGEEITRLRGLLAGWDLLDPRVRANRRRTRWQRLVDRWTGRVTLRRAGAVHLHPEDDVAPEFLAAFNRAVAAGRPAPDVVVTSGRLLRRQLVEATVPAPAAARVLHRLHTRRPATGAGDVR
jgi:hypothetical protein